MLDAPIGFSVEVSELESRHAESHVHCNLSLDRKRLKGDGSSGSADEDVGAQSQADADIGARQQDSRLTSTSLWSSENEKTVAISGWAKTACP
jgi:hypothetical protein